MLRDILNDLKDFCEDEIYKDCFKLTYLRIRVKDNLQSGYIKTFKRLTP